MTDITFSGIQTGQSAYQVVPDPDEPVILQLNGQLCRVEEISAYGFTCRADRVESGRRTRFSLGLPTVSNDIEGYVDVLPHGDNRRLQCRFAELSAETIDMLHHYALVRQKEVLRSLRSRKQLWG